MIKLLIIDKFVLYRKCLAQVLEADKELNVVEETSNFETNHKTNKKDKYDLILLHVGNDYLSSIGTLKDIRKTLPEIPVIAYGFEPTDSIHNRFLGLGAADCLDYNVTLTKFIKNLKKYPKSPGKKINSSFDDESSSRILEESLLIDKLSKKELIVLKMIAQGITIKNIAKGLALKISTIHTFRTRMMNKLKLTNNVEIALFALKNKLIKSSELMV
jgi:DNA-binding NarL/FixJ family response regulator